MNSSVCLLALLGILSYCSASYYSQYQGYKGYKKYTYSGKPNTYLDIYKNQGFQQEGSVVYYRKTYYDIKCDVKQFYVKLNACYSRYRGLKYCLNRLSRYGVLYKRVSYSKARKQSYLYGGHAVAAASAHAHAGIAFPWPIYKKRFSYNKKVYQLDCTQKNLYNKWNLCYKLYNNKDKCFGMLYGQKLFHVYVSASAHAHASSQGGNAVSSASAHAHAHAVISFPWTIYKNRFTYNKKVYQLDCTQKNLYDKWNLCYKHYYNKAKCFGMLYGQKLFHIYVSASAQAHAQSSSQGGNAASSASAHAHAHAVVSFPWTIFNNRFSYNKKVYQLDCTQQNLYDKWNRCYKHYYNKDKCFGMLYGQKLFHIYVSASAQAHAQSSSQGGNAASSASAHAHAHAVIAFPWTIYNNMFSYNKKVYQLDCTEQNLYNHWDRCYKHYYNKDKCFGMLYGQKLFHIYVSASAQAHAQSSSQGGNAASSASAHAHAHAVVSFPWTIFNNRFSYNKKVYQLDCTQQNLYDKWNLCYKHYYNKDKCFGMLYGQKLFHIYVSASAQAHAQSSSQGGNAASSASALAHAHAVIAFPWTIYNNMFSYNKKVYQLDCTEQNLYNHWDRCYKHYYNKDKCFGMLYGQKLFHIYVSASAQAHAQSSSQGGNAASSATAHAHAHAVVSFPWAIYNNRFTYNKKVYQLDCTQQNLYDKWNLCYKHYYNKAKCFGMLYGQKLFHIYVSASAHAHAHASSQGGNAVSSASAHAHAHAAIAFPWPIYKNKFVYNQKVYQLDIDKNDLYKHWNGCYLHHHDQHRCFGLLFNHKFFHLFNYASASAHATAHAASSG